MDTIDEDATLVEIEVGPASLSQPAITREWNTEHEADSEIINYFKTAISRLRFYLEHPLIEEVEDDGFQNHLKEEIARLTRLLNKALYN